MTHILRVLIRYYVYVCVFVTHYTVINGSNCCREEIEKINNDFSLASNFQDKEDKQFLKIKFSLIAQTRD